MKAGKVSRPHIGFIGTGNMGSRMSSRLLAAGYSMTVYDRTRGRMNGLKKSGAAIAVNARKLASVCDVIMSSVTNDAAIDAVMFGENGALAGARPGKVFIDLSTVYPTTSRRAFTAAREKGASMLDAPVSGSTPQAEQGTLVIMVGGEKKTYEKYKSLLSVLGKEVVYIGPSGSGATMKLVVNTLLGAGLQAVAEAVALGEKAGLDREKLLDVLGGTAVISPAHKMKLVNVRRGTYPATFPLELMHKDFGLIMRLAEEFSVPMPATAAAFQMCSAEKAKNIGKDYSAIIGLMRKLSALPPRS